MIFCRRGSQSRSHVVVGDPTLLSTSLRCCSLPPPALRLCSSVIWSLLPDYGAGPKES